MLLRLARLDPSVEINIFGRRVSCSRAWGGFTAANSSCLPFPTFSTYSTTMLTYFIPYILYIITWCLLKSKKSFFTFFVEIFSFETLCIV